MKDQEILQIWKLQDQKLDQILLLNKEIATELTMNKIIRKIDQLKYPKILLLLFGIPYTLLLFFIAYIGFQSGGIFVTLGFGIIAIIMSIVICIYIYHLYIISKINNDQEVFDVQKDISHLTISSFNCIRFSLFQIPFWSICWMSWDALLASPFLYGGVNMIVFLGLSYLAYWLYKNLDVMNRKSRLGRFFFTGPEWIPLFRSSELLEELKGYHVK